MFKWVNKSLRNKAIVALILLGVIPLLITGAIINLLTSKLLNTKMNQMAEQTIDNISLIVSKNLQGFIDIAFYIAQNKNIQNLTYKKLSNELDKQEIFYSIKNELFSKPLISRSDYPYQYIILNKYGDVFTNFYFLDKNESNLLEQTLKKTTWYDYLKKSPIPRILIVIGPNYLSPRFEDQIYVCGNIFKNFDHAGIVLIGIDKYYISKLIENMRLSKKSSIYILNGNQCIIEGDNNFIPFKNLPEKLISEITLSNKKTSFNFNIDGKNQFVTCRNLYIKDAEGDWKIIQITASEDIKKEINYINFVIIGMILLSIVTVIILVILINKTIINPVLQLSKFAKQIQSGNLEARTNYTREDEIGMLAFVFNNMAKELKTHIDQIKEKENLKRMLEIEVLQSQINPHFIRNTLNIVKWLAEMTGAVSVAKAIMSIIELINYNYSISDSTVTIREEIKYLEDYIYLQKLRYQNKFVSRIEVDNEILDASILKLILQPIIENSIIHGFEKKTGLGLLTIIGKRVDDKIIFTVSDDGIGMSKDKINRILNQNQLKSNSSDFQQDLIENQKDAVELLYANKVSQKSIEIIKNKNKIGLINVIQRIKLNYGPQYGLTIKSKKNVGTTVQIIIPYIKISNK